MPGSLTIKIDSSRLTGALQEAAKRLTNVAGAGFVRQFVRVQAAAVLSNCIKFTPTPNFDGALARAEKRLDAKFNHYGNGAAGRGNKQSIAGLKFESVPGDGDAISISVKTGRTWLRQKGRYYRTNDPARKWGPARWEDWETQSAMRQKDLRQAEGKAAKNIKRSINLSKKSWLQSAQALGIEGLLKKAGTASASKALTQAGFDPKNGAGTEQSDPGKVIITLINSTPMLTSGKNPQGQRILQGAIDSRVKALSIELSKGTYDTLERIMKRYPGMRVK